MKAKKSSRDNSELRENVRRGRNGRDLPRFDARKVREELNDYFERRRRRLDVVATIGDAEPALAEN